MASSGEADVILPGMGKTELSTVLNWLRSFCQLHGPEDSVLMSTQGTFVNQSLNFLPSELLKAIDVTLDAYFKALARKEGWLAEVAYREVIHTIGYNVLDSVSSAPHMHREIEAWAIRIQHLYHNLDRPHDVHPVDKWERTLFAPSGITTAKLARLPSLDALIRSLEAFENEVVDRVAQGKGLPPVADLPTATSILFDAYLAATTSSSRLDTCRRFFQHLITLYSHVKDRSAVLHLDEALFQLNKREAGQHFEGLSLEQQ